MTNRERERGNVTVALQDVKASSTVSILVFMHVPVKQCVVVCYGWSRKCDEVLVLLGLSVEPVIKMFWITEWTDSGN